MAKDEQLYSGINSQSFGRALRQRVNEENVTKKQVLRPYAQIVFDEIEKQKAEALDLKTFILNGQTETDVKLELAIRKRTYHNLVNLQNRFNTILRAEPKIVKIESLEDETEL